MLFWRELIFGCVGDARAVLYGSEGYSRLTVDHKAFSEEESKAIRERGGFVTEDGRLCGILAISRSLGMIIPSVIG